MKKTILFSAILSMLAWTGTLHAANTECAGLETTHADGNPFSDGYKYEFKTNGAEVVVTFEMIDEKDGVVAFLWNKTSGFSEKQLTHVEGRKFSISLPSQTMGQELTLACKFAYAGGMSVTQDFKYTVGNKCSSGEEEPDTEAPSDVTAVIGKVAYNNIELLLNGTDDSGAVIYEIAYGETVRITSGGSGVEKSYLISGLDPNTTYMFSITAKDAAGNVSVNSPITISGTTTENLNTECAGITTDVSEGTPFDLGCQYQFKTIGADVLVSLEVLDSKIGLVAYLWDKTTGFKEVMMAHDSGQKYTYTLEGQTLGSKITIAAKFAYAGGMTIIKDLQYTVGEDCSGNAGEEDTEAPTNFSATVGDVTSGSVQFLLNGTDNSGVVIYEISYDGITKVVSGVSGVEKVYVIADLLANKTYEFSIIARDAAGNQAANNPQQLSVDTPTRVNECSGLRGHFGTPQDEKISFELKTSANGDVLIKVSPIDGSKQINFAEAQTTKGNLLLVVADDQLSATASLTGVANGDEIGIRFLYSLSDMPGNEMTSETLLLSDPNIIYYLVGDNCDPTTIDEVGAGKTLVVYPNPVKSELTVRSEVGIEHISIYSTSGQVVKSVNVGGLLEKTITVDALTPSAYILIIKKSDKTVTFEKIIKQ